jgi:pyruvyltransferase
MRTYAGLNLSGVPLGDPALLMPKFFNPKKSKRSKIGVIPHFSEIDFFTSNFSWENRDICLVDVRAKPEEFVNQLVACEYVISSSLHGLILADAYSIPNKWVIFTDKLIGGQFKFKDYYSTTSNPDEFPIYLNSREDFRSLTETVEQMTNVKTYQGSLDALLDSFPSEISRK